MASYVNDLRLKEIGTGESSGTWGTETNTNLELIGDALGFGTEAITTNADTHTTTVADGSADAGRAMYIKYTGTLDSACTITIGPNTINRMHFIENATTGSQNIIISQGTGSNVTIPAGDVKAVYLDGAGSGAAVADAFASLNVVDLKVQDDFTVTDDMTVGGTLGVTGILTCSDDIIIGDGKTIGSASDVDAMTIASNGQVTFSQTLIGTALDISGDIDVDGTANLDVVDIDGAVDMASTLAVGGALTVTESSAATAATFKVDNGSAQVANVVISNNADTGLNLGVFGASAGTAGMISASDAFITTSTTELNVGINNSAGIIKFGVGNGSSTASEAMRVHSNARVAISTTAPNANLHVGSSNATGDATNPAIQIGGSTSYRLGMYTSAEGGVIENKNGDDGIQFRVKTAGEAMRIDGGTGKVSIGTTTADRELKVQKSGDHAIIAAVSGTSSLAGMVMGDTDDDDIGHVLYNNSNNSMSFRTNTSDRMTIDSSGNVGIGSSTINAKLNVHGIIRAENSPFYAGREDAAAPAYAFHDDADTGMFNVASNILGFSTAGSERMRIDSSGKLLIGTTSSAVNDTGIKLNENGTCVFTCNLTSENENIIVNNNNSTGTVYKMDFRQNNATKGSISCSSTAVSFNTSSDARLKNVLGEAKGLEIVNKLNPVHFEWKKSGIGQDGLIAQEVEPIVPNAVLYNKDSDVYQLDYSKLVTPLVKAVQELYEQVDALQSEIKTLKGE